MKFTVVRLVNDGYEAWTFEEAVFDTEAEAVQYAESQERSSMHGTTYEVREES
jgi:hypothetical protein